ncbi:hypothetical protein, partial [Helicobacter sp. 'CLO3_human']|uniref:hypothetical protein n=1 Tax=Helicobacter sp. 'CLO3_human' TaxID=2020249 RepID=UPI001F3CD708
MRAILNFFRSKTITFEKAKQEGEITEEKLVREGENLFLCGNGIYPYTDGKSLDMLIDKLGGGGGGSHPKKISFFLLWKERENKNTQRKFLIKILLIPFIPLFL